MERSRLLRALGVNLWSAFLWAGVATTLFFATFDPEVIAINATYPASLSAEAGYTLGFLLFWALLSLHGACVQYLGSSETKQK